MADEKGGEARAVTAPAGDDPTSSARAGQRRTLLIVEDEVMVRFPLAQYLREAGYQVIEASNASDAMALFDSGSAIELVIADFKLPGGPTGYMLSDWLELRHPTIPLILTSGLTSTLPGFLKGSMRRFVAKPYTFDDIAWQIGKMLGAKT